MRTLLSVSSARSEGRQLAPKVIERARGSGKAMSGSGPAYPRATGAYLRLGCRLRWFGPTSSRHKWSGRPPMALLEKSLESSSPTWPSMGGGPAAMTAGRIAEKIFDERKKR